jgi:hypothetical protein
LAELGGAGIVEDWLFFRNRRLSTASLRLLGDVIVGDGLARFWVAATPVDAEFPCPFREETAGLSGVVDPGSLDDAFAECVAVKV